MGATHLGVGTPVENLDRSGDPQSSAGREESQSGQLAETICGHASDGWIQPHLRRGGAVDSAEAAMSWSKMTPWSSPSVEDSGLLMFDIYHSLAPIG